MGYIVAKKLYTDGLELTNQLIGVENGRITDVRPVAEGSDEQRTLSEECPVYDCVAPGFIDIHINGGDELHLTENPSQEAIVNMLEASRASGTPYLLPTCVTSSWENIRRAVAAVKSFMDGNPSSGVLGLHLEGPFISPIKRGAHLEAFILPPDDHLLETLKREGEGVLKLLTLAPELFTIAQLEGLLEAGIIVSAGHSNATYEEAKQAFDVGVNACTHLYNAMSSFGHRAPGLVGAVFDTAHVFAPIIGDGAHCDYAAVRTAYRLKKDKLILISDALFLDRKKQRFTWGAFDATLVGDRYINSEGNLAGGALSLPEIVTNVVTKVGIALPEAIQMVTSRPAALLNMQREVGHVKPGFPAVFTVFSENLSAFRTLAL